MATVNRLLADDLVFSLGGTSRFAGRHVGRDTVLGVLAQLNGALGISNEVRGMYESGDGVVVHQTGSAPGYSDTSLTLFTISEGQVSEVTEFLFDPVAFDHFVAAHDRHAFRTSSDRPG